MQFDEDEKAMIQVVANHWELIFILFSCPKCDLDEVDKALFQGDAFHFDNLLTIPKCDFGEFQKTMFKDLEWHSQIIFGL